MMKVQTAANQYSAGHKGNNRDTVKGCFADRRCIGTMTPTGKWGAQDPDQLQRCWFIRCYYSSPLASLLQNSCS